MVRCLALVLALLLAAGGADAAAKLERVVTVMRHGIRPPTQSNAELARYAAQAWPDWPVAPGELTPHGGESVKLMGRTLRAAYVARGLLPAKGCAGAGQVSVWADGADQRTRQTGVDLAASVEPGCDVKTGWAAPRPRDPIFGGDDSKACMIDAAHAYGTGLPPPSPAELARLEAATARLQAIMAPKACDGGAGMCFKISPADKGLFPSTAGLAEDLLLEYADGKPLTDVGWGRAREADIDAIMPLHEAGFARLRDNVYASARRGAPMTRVILAALAGEPAKGGPQSGPALRFLGLAGHDTNLVWMASTFGFDWTLPNEPDSTAPSTALAFELWRDGARRYVRPVLYYETLDQLRTLKPAAARAVPLTFKDCASGPHGSCPLETVKARIDALLPADCG
ncbi:MAG TPA: histidine-type phosphatase [Caulobacteraceae bacterium]|jgi:4-phytase/acid phosphatase